MPSQQRQQQQLRSQQQQETIPPSAAPSSPPASAPAPEQSKVGPPKVLFQARRYDDGARPNQAKFSCPFSQYREHLFTDRESLLRHVRAYHPEVAQCDPESTFYKSYVNAAAERAKWRNHHMRNYGHLPVYADNQMKTMLFGHAFPPGYPALPPGFLPPHALAPPQFQPFPGPTSPNRVATGIDGLSLEPKGFIEPGLGPAVPSKRAATHEEPDMELDTGSQLGFHNPGSEVDNRKRQNESPRQWPRPAQGKKARHSPGRLGKRDPTLGKARPHTPSLIRATGEVPVDKESNRAQAPESSLGQRLSTNLDAVIDESALDSATETLDDDLGSGHDEDSSVEVLLQPQTKDITLEQLEAEVNNICRAVDQCEISCREDYQNKLPEARLPRDHRPSMSQEAYQRYIGRHKAFMQEIHDLCLATQHPVASAELRALPRKMNIPARMWQFGIAAPLEILRMLLPDSKEHAITFILICFNMMTLFYETVPEFSATWQECLGDLARYRLGLAEDEEKEIFCNIATYWFRCALDHGPQIGRLRHHLAVLVPSPSVEQLSLYGHALTAYTPFFAARRSLLASLRPVLEDANRLAADMPRLTFAFLRAHASLYVGGLGSSDTFHASVMQITTGLFDEFARSESKDRAGLKKYMCHLAIANSAALFEYGATTESNQDRSILRYAFLTRHVSKAQISSSPPYSPPNSALGQSFTSWRQAPIVPGGNDVLSRITISHASKLAFRMLSLAFRQPKDENLHPMVHVSLVMIWAFMGIPMAARETESMIPWLDMVSFLNTYANALTMKVYICSTRFLHSKPAHGEALPEDFMMQGLWFSQDYLPGKWCEDANMDLQERLVEKESYVSPRIERMLWLGYGIASHQKWIRYEAETKSFSVNNDYLQKLAPQSPAVSSQDVLELQPLFPSESQPGTAQSTTPTWNTPATVPSLVSGASNPRLTALSLKWAKFREQCETFLSNPPATNEALVRRRMQLGDQIAQDFLAELETSREDQENKDLLRQDMSAMIRKINPGQTGKKSSGTFDIYSDRMFQS